MSTPAGITPRQVFGQTGGERCSVSVLLRRRTRLRQLGPWLCGATENVSAHQLGPFSSFVCCRILFIVELVVEQQEYIHTLSGTRDTEENIILPPRLMIRALQYTMNASMQHILCCTVVIYMSFNSRDTKWRTDTWCDWQLVWVFSSVWEENHKKKKSFCCCWQSISKNTHTFALSNS